MNNKLLLITLTAAVIAAISLSSCHSRSGNPNQNTAVKEEETTDGVVYSYSSGGSGNITESKTYEGGRVVSRSEYEYWENNRLKTVTVYDASDSISDTWNYIYYSDGGLQRSVRQYNNGSMPCTDTYDYDENGNVLSLVCRENGNTVGSVTYSYTDGGKLQLEQTLDKNGDVTAYTEYSFDENGNTTSSHTYMYGSLSSYKEFVYEDQRLTGITEYTGSGKLSGSVVYTYDENGNITRTENRGADGKVTGYTESLYDSDGFNYKDIYYENGSPKYSYDYTKEGAKVYTEY